MGLSRSCDTELLECSDAPEHAVAGVYRDIARIHRLLGDTTSIIAAVRHDPMPVRRVLDVGCGDGRVLREVGKRLSVDVVGVDIRKPHALQGALPILQADAVRGRLPAADVAYSMYLGHHLSEDELVRLIRNVGRYCRRFILLDLVRHRVPLALFRMFVAPFFSRIVRVDGGISIRRAYTRSELTRIAREALVDTRARFTHKVAPLYARQMLDIAY